MLIFYLQPFCSRERICFTTLQCRRHKRDVFWPFENYLKTSAGIHMISVSYGRFALLNTFAFLRELWRDPKWFKTPVMHFPSQLHSLIFTGFVRASAVALQTNQPNSFHSLRSNVDYSHRLASSQTNPESRREFYMPRDAREKLVSSQARMSFRHVHKSNLFPPDRLINLDRFV